LNESNILKDDVRKKATILGDVVPVPVERDMAVCVLQTGQVSLDAVLAYTQGECIGLSVRTAKKKISEPGPT
jgi:hypothetical protein